MNTRLKLWAIVAMFFIGNVITAEAFAATFNVDDVAAAQNSVLGENTNATYPNTTELEVLLNEFARSLVDRDVDTVWAIVSNEIIARADQRGMDLPAFIEKERAALLRTFNLGHREHLKLEVAEAIPEGDAIRVIMRARGKKLSKPFYFVREGNDYKLNVALPGFSKAPPDGALFGRSNYRVRNIGSPGPSFGLSCYQGRNRPGKTVIVPAGSTRNVSCEDACGFWSGTLFQDFDSFEPHVKACDWNAWGDDVQIRPFILHGWQCVDYC